MTTKTTQAQIEALRRAAIACTEAANALTAAAEVGEKADLEAIRLYRYLNGLDQDSHDKRAEHVMYQSLDGLTVGPGNRNSTKEMLANHFEAIEDATIERCAKVADLLADATPNPVACVVGEKIAAAIRALKEKP